jgi:hypothetical protein
LLEKALVMKVKTEVLIKGTGFRASWINARLKSSKEDYLIDGQSVYDTELIPYDCESQLYKSKTKNPLQAKINYEMLLKMKVFCENYNNIRP